MVYVRRPNNKLSSSANYKLDNQIDIDPFIAISLDGNLEVQAEKFEYNINLEFS